MLARKVPSVLSPTYIPPPSDYEPEDDKEYADVTLRDLVRVDTLGMGGFGRVELVCMEFVVQSNHEQSLLCESSVFDW